VLFLSDHGNGPVYYGVYINNWLVKEKHMMLKRTLTTRSKAWAFRRGFNLYNLFRTANRLGILPGVEEAYAKRSRSIELVKRISLSFMDVDWDRTRVYSFGNYGQLYVNLKGREPHGIVEPGADYDACVESVRKGLAELKDPKSGARIFDEIITNKELYKGAQAPDGPDILFVDSKMLYDAHRFFEFASNSLVTPHPVYSGNHKLEGILLCSGSGLRGRGGVTSASINDITPTVLALLGMDIPSYMDGRVIEEFVGDASPIRKRVVELQTVQEGQETQVFSDAENEELTERLKDLGYV
jgi:predicted AlkP superfamily phosphohydrolase/phosphomutase